MKPPTLELIKQLRDEGMSIRKIYLTLKEQGYVSASGKPISTSTIYLWLKGEDRCAPAEVTRLVQQVIACKSLSAEKKNQIIGAIVAEEV